MKKLSKLILSMLCATFIAVPVLFCAACGTEETPDDKGGDNADTPTIEAVDYASQLKLNLNSETKKQEVEVRLFIDGDTTHFNPVTNSTITGYNAADFAGTQGYIKARYLAINTPESTGKIEKWGKTASNFTHDKLENAESIIVESDDSKWNIDSTGERYLLWVWYKPAGENDYRNLNVEILQEGLALASSTANNRYGEIAVKALDQAKALKRYVYSPASTVDENFYEGAAISMTLKELRCHLTDYIQKSVRVEGVVTAKYSNTAYIEDKDEETGLYFGISVFYGNTAYTSALEGLLAIGSRVCVIGSVTEFNGTYQLSGLEYNEFRPNPDTNSSLVSPGHSAAFVETSAKDIVSGKVEVKFETEDDEGELKVETVNLDYAEAIMSTTVTVSNLKVLRVRPTDNGGKSDGALSIYCQAEDGTEITVRTQVLTDENGKIITADKYEGKVITVKGLVAKFVPNQNQPETFYYQVGVHLADYITIVG